MGATSKTSSTLDVRANASGTDGGALLANSDSWTDYTFQAKLDWLKGSTFGLVARHADDGDYVLCTFEEETAGMVHIWLRQYHNYVPVILAGGTIPNYNQLGGADITAAIAVFGNQATCSFNYHSISTLTANSSLQPPLSGGIGFMTSDADVNNSEIIVKTVGVSQTKYDLGPNAQL